LKLVSISSFADAFETDELVRQGEHARLLHRAEKLLSQVLIAFRAGSRSAFGRRAWGFYVLACELEDVADRV